MDDCRLTIDNLKNDAPVLPPGTAPVGQSRQRINKLPSGQN